MDRLEVVGLVALDSKDLVATNGGGGGVHTPVSPELPPYWWYRHAPHRY